MEEFQSIEELHKACLLCQKCGLRIGAKQVIPGEGNSDAEIMLIGEGPGATEDREGRPFVGAAGKFLEIMLNSIGLNRQDVFIANMVKCRPPENRDPTKEEKEICRTWLQQQVSFVNPKIFVPLGRHALWMFLPNAVISQVHGKIFKNKEAFVFASYHPAAALYNGSMRSVLIEDFKNLEKFLKNDFEFEIG